MILYTYILSIFTIGFSDALTGFPIYRALTIFLFAIAVTSQLLDKTFYRLSKFYVVLFSMLLVLMILKRSNIGQYQISGYLNIMVLFYVSFFVLKKYKLKEIFLKYINVCFLFSVIAVIQEVAYLLKIDLSFMLNFVKGENITTSGPFLRVFSLTAEPSHLALLLMPVIIYMIICSINDKNIFLSKFVIMTIYLAYVLTFSTIAMTYIVILIIVVFMFGTKRIFKPTNLLMIFISCTVFYFMSNTDAINEKLNGAKDISVVNEMADSSSFAIQSNLFVVGKVLNESPFFGNGPFTHENSYNKYISDIYYIDDDFRFLNTKDAASLYLRVASEFGLIGCALFVVILLYCLNKARYDLSLLIFVISLLCFSLRNGNYDHPLLWLIIAAIVDILEKNKNNYSELDFFDYHRPSA